MTSLYLVVWLNSYYSTVHVLVPRTKINGFWIPQFS